MGFGTHSHDKKPTSFLFCFSHKQRLNATICVNSVVQFLCFPSFSHSKFLAHYSFPTWEFFCLLRCWHVCGFFEFLWFSAVKAIVLAFHGNVVYICWKLNDWLISHSSFVTNQMMTSVSLAKARGNKMVFPMALLGWAWKLNTAITNVSSVEWMSPQTAVCPNVKSMQGSRRKVDFFVMVDVFLVILVDLSAFWSYLPSWLVQSQYWSCSKTFLSSLIPSQTWVLAWGGDRS